MIITADALSFTMQIETADNLRILLSALIAIINERPCNSPQQYLEALKQVSNKKNR